MKARHVLLSSIALMGMSFFGSQNASASANPSETQDSTNVTPIYALESTSSELEKEKFFSQVKIYGGDGNLIPYTREELEEFITFEPAASAINLEDTITPFSMYTTFDYGPMTFSYGYYIGKGTYGEKFLNPAETIVTVNGTAKDFSIIAYYDNGSGGVGNKAYGVEFGSGWSGTVHYGGWATGLPRDKSYRFYVNNNAGKSFTINNIQVWYNWQG